MNEESEKKNTAENLETEARQALRELGIENIDWKRRITAAEVLYLLDQCPFLQITDTALAVATEIQPLKLIEAKSGWKIHDYGNALSSSPGELLFGKQKDDDEGGGGAGTIVNQAVITAFEMVELAKQHGWTGIQLVDGHPLMAWAAWMQALDSGLEIEGYTPTANDHSKRRRIKGAIEQMPSKRPSL